MYIFAIIHKFSMDRTPMNRSLTIPFKLQQYGTMVLYFVVIITIKM